MPFELIGVTDPSGGALEVHGQFRISLDELRTAHTETLPRLFGGAAAVEVPAPAAGVAGAVEGVPLPVAEAEPVDPAEVVSEPIASFGPVPQTGAVQPIESEQPGTAAESDPGVAEPSPDER